MRKMKKNISKILLSLIMAFAMSLSVMSTNVFAEEGSSVEYTIYIANVNVVTNEYWKLGTDGVLTTDMASASDYNVRWDGTNHKLYLNNLVTSARKGSSGWMKSSILIDTVGDVTGDLDIVVEGANRLEPTLGSDSPAYIAIASYLDGGTLTFSGTGSLEAIDRWSGLYTSGPLFFKGSGTYSFISDGGTDVGMSASSINILDTCKVTSKGSNYGLYTSDFRIDEDAILTCEGGIAAFLGNKNASSLLTFAPTFHDGVNFVSGIMELNVFDVKYNQEDEFYTVKDAKDGTTQKYIRLSGFGEVPHIHVASTAWSKDATNHWHECMANDNEKMNVASHTFGEWVIDMPATETTKGNKYRACAVCGQREVAEIAAIGVTPRTPTITAGAGSTHQISNSKNMTLTCSGKLEDLTGIYVDGKLVDPSNYTLKSGSTILTLKASYLDTLSAGKHIVKFQYIDNISAETDFTITAKEAPKNEPVIKDTILPKTNDNSNLAVYAFGILLSGYVVGTVTYRRKKAASN